MIGGSSDGIIKGDEPRFRWDNTIHGRRHRSGQSQSGSNAKRIKREEPRYLSEPDSVDMLAVDKGSISDDECCQLSPDNNFTSSEVIPDDLLAKEIFPRLADSRSAIRCSAVSKRWHSLLTAPEFLPNFLRRRRSSSYTMFTEFRFSCSKTRTIRQLYASNLIVEEGSSFTATGPTSDYNLATELALDSACDDFLLLSRIITNRNWVTTRNHYIRNAVTGLQLELPKLPIKEQHGFSALVSHRDNSTLSGYNFRVVYLYRDSIVDRPLSDRIIVFSSETGRWSVPARAPLSQGMPGVVAYNGLLFWLDILQYKRLVIFNAFKGCWGLIDLPADLVLPRNRYRGSAVELGPAEEVVQLGSKKHPRIGVVKGRVRFGQLFRVVAGGRFFMKIWELSYDKWTWSLVSEVQLRDPPVHGTKWIYLFSFHPDDTDVVFLCCDCDVFRYCVSRGQYETVFRLSCIKGDEEKSVNDWLPRFAHVLTVRLPAWPTTMPTLPSSVF